MNTVTARDRDFHWLSATGWSRLAGTGLDFGRFAWDFFIRRSNRPFIVGLVITDKCNLSCQHCRVANVDGVSMTFSEICRHLEEQFEQGIRFLFLEGGEPYLWRDGRYRLENIIERARRIGYFSVQLFTNGMVRLGSAPDFTWISLDGLEDCHERLRGAPMQRVLDRLRSFDGRWGIVYTVNSVNAHQIGDFLRFVHREFPGRGTLFHLHTPYYGIDHLLLGADRRQAVLRELAALKRAGLPVLNSHAALRAVATGNYPHPNNLWRVIDPTGAYPCCRAVDTPGVCDQCGYMSCAEIVLARDGRPGPVRQMLSIV